MIPKFCPLFSGELTSAIYAMAVVIEAPITPAMILPTNSQAIVGATASNR